MFWRLRCPANMRREGGTAAVAGLLRPHQHKCHTVTFDNGKEFARQN